MMTDVGNSHTALIEIDAVREIAERELHLSAGRMRLGTIFAVGRSFMAFDLADRHVVTCPKLPAAVAALPMPGAAHAG